MAALFRTSADSAPAAVPSGWGLQPELPPPGQPPLPRQPPDAPWAHAFKLQDRTPHVPDPNAATPPTLADAVTDLIAPGGGGIASPAVVQVAAGQSHLSTYLVLGAVIVGGVLAFRWWQQHQQQHHGRAAR